ncbi:MAG: DoxX family protein [Prevotellaceae bacterium]|jgi:uncharacterized membrane protein YphA (DoxX/SURF4 family)|nr:DoxX family protein [Prevotellaceae bacterium]
MKKKVGIYTFITGILFLITGIAKSLNVSAFSDLITQYGFDRLSFLAPFIVLAEVFFGLLLIFNLGLKHTAVACMFLTALFTLIYFYGFAFNGIEDCGCFGEITVLNTSFVFTFIRNAVLIYLLIVVWRNSENSWKMNKWIAGFVLAVMCMVAFISGYTYRSASKIQNTGKYATSTVDNTILKEFVSTSGDSTYLVFVFTYFCPHCMNSIENLKQYESLDIVDKVIGIALEDTIAERKFREIFKPEFVIKNYPAKILFRLTNSFPVAYYIKHNSIVAEISGELPCGYIFAQKIR